MKRNEKILHYGGLN
ncbi:hypothetical protein ACP1O1_002520 [Escherichia coli]|nr:hypothetical protein [Escherichia coli]EHK4170827.1 hypothetical protein [Escherichia coli]EHK4974978.1 hypothetical protein [Escherichia coli]EHL0988887.1 hypothetical protein [Escherichia coli]EIA1100592.1 hypothetical protein [Escherichia coli]EIB8088993.1 hypothetical protein [Escherichia coli]